MLTSPERPSVKFLVIWTPGLSLLSSRVASAVARMPVG